MERKGGGWRYMLNRQAGAVRHGAVEFERGTGPTGPSEPRQVSREAHSGLVGTRGIVIGEKLFEV